MGVCIQICVVRAPLVKFLAVPSEEVNGCRSGAEDTFVAKTEAAPDDLDSPYIHSCL